ncbi:MAG TPA: ROK family transcriptional regulator [Jatrophihabitans sp.]|nr:ROK family transcriptional regulator [Jatrophihabitans sp.]
MLDHIHRDGALTRAELTQRLAVSRSTVGALVADLIELGLVDEVVPSGGSGVGRPSHVVGPHPAGPYVVAVDIDVTQVITAAVGIGGTLLARDVVTTGVDACGPDNVARIVVEAVTRVSGATARDLAPLSIGVSLPGTVDRYTGLVAVAPNLEWRDVAFGTLLADKLASRTNVSIGNDADLAALAEHSRGGARGIDDVVFLLGRVGVGAGIIANGRPLRGYDGYAGEIGHNVVDAAGPACHCGKHGCVETYIGEEALLRIAGREQPPTEAATAAVFADARHDDPEAVRAVHEVAVSLGRAIASLVNTLNPQLVVLGGHLAELLDIAQPDVERALREYAFEEQARDVQLVAPSFGSDSALLGAAELAFAPLLADPLTVGGALLG